jgi:hypothetical protein
MKMEMPDRLSAVAVAVYDKAEAIVCESFIPRDSAGGLEDRVGQTGGRPVKVHDRGDVKTGNNEIMAGSLGREIFDGHHVLVLVDEPGRAPAVDDTTENTILRHRVSPPERERTFAALFYYTTVLS